ncbi:hypothetical protein [Pyruvatibacter mobilis]|uniref:hypothetical protein n=1 Tax=Pyruvatibacter mobilis TaxID=1712261 RepID=UPI003C7C9771
MYFFEPWAATMPSRRNSQGNNQPASASDTPGKALKPVELRGNRRRRNDQNDLEKASGEKVWKDDNKDVIINPLDKEKDRDISRRRGTSKLNRTAKKNVEAFIQQVFQGVVDPELLREKAHYAAGRIIGELVTPLLKDTDPASTVDDVASEALILSQEPLVHPRPIPKNHPKYKGKKADGDAVAFYDAHWRDSDGFHTVYRTDLNAYDPKLVRAMENELRANTKLDRGKTMPPPLSRQIEDRLRDPSTPEAERRRLQALINARESKRAYNRRNRPNMTMTIK